MAQIFRPSANGVSRALLALLAGGLVVWALLAYGLLRSDYVTGVGAAPDQPVPFSHRHHVNGLGIDCRYCHNGVETAPFAGLPSTRVCMTCHSRLWTHAEMLAPVRESLARDKPLRWTRVNDLADFVYFDHSIHVSKGVGCVTCHGRVDLMPLTRRANAFYMKFCLECHRNPERYLRPREAVFDLDWRPPDNRDVLGARLVESFGLNPERMDDCYLCHR